MVRKAEPRDTTKPEPRTAPVAATERKDPPKPVIREIYADWAML